MKLRILLAAASTWAAVCCALLALSSSHGGGAAGALNVWALAGVAAVAVAVTATVAAPRLPTVIGYLIAHGIGVLVVLTVSQGLRPPWQWRPLSELWPITGGQLALNPAAVTLLSTALTWELSYACAWLVVRERRAWLALGLIVATLALGGPHVLQRPDAALVGFSVVGLGVVLAAATLERRARPTRRLHGMSGARWAPLYGLPLLGLVVAGAWAAPPVAVPNARAALTHWTAQVTNLTGHIGLGSKPVGDGRAALTEFGSAVPVGGVFNPNGAIVFTARVADPTRWPYWRGAVYDRYEDGAWRPVPTHPAFQPAGTAIGATGAAAADVITQSVTLLRPLNTLVTAGVPVTLSVPVAVAFSNRAHGAGPLALQPASGRMPAAYAATSLVAPAAPVVPAPVLDPAVRAVDLALPSLPVRVGSLARSLVRGTADPYAQTWAIQRYLRGVGSKYVYDTSPPQAPAGHDPTDYFLFDARRGFCTHFASAMVVLARLAGIPARLVTGYASTRLTAGGFVVTTADAHAWPELWIAGRGWLTFEPTPAFHTPFQIAGPLTAPPVAATATPPQPSPTTRGHAATATAPARTPTTSPTPTRTPVASAPSAPGSGQGGAGASPRFPLAGLVAAAAGLLLAGLLWLLVLAAPSDVLVLYRRMCRLASLLRAGPRAGQTPLEWARGLAVRTPGDSAAVLAITGLYVRQRYGNQRAAGADLQAARASWRRLQRRWIWRVLTRRRL